MDIVEMRQDKLYTTAEVCLATGLGRGTITGRAAKLGFTRTGNGYTFEQVKKIISAPMENHRKSEAMAVELRQRLNEWLEKDQVPMAIVSNTKGDWNLEYRAGRTGKIK